MGKHDIGVEKVLVTADQIQERLKELGKQITTDFYDSKEPIVIVVLMKGAAVFAADLIRHIELPLHLDFMIASSYGNGTTSSREVRIIKDLQESIMEKNVIVVDDIIDTGHTFAKILEILEGRGPKPLNTCTLLDKAEARELEVPVDYCGFNIPNEFVIGYGLDYAQCYRNLPYIGILNPDLI